MNLIERVRTRNNTAQRVKASAHWFNNGPKTAVAIQDNYLGRHTPIVSVLTPEDIESLMAGYLARHD